MTPAGGKPRHLSGNDEKRVLTINNGGEMESFKKELERLINLHSIENFCDIPDFLLAEMVVTFIETVGITVKKTLDWHGCNSICHPKQSD